ncbi:Rieske (2Fe-2S) domain-containing protein [Salinarchaeum sp. Harcht-Bsk1]|uniref:Rieske 2Fe-2S domain-containing protein n=1 Tax=Salinarchaeum sp. Harcht-Bsk1 TaxID=1333523 RepID=UPI00034230A5|nr:Rieske 2Fe-2S domain-containing protein [Salinarchaeum sp. Harcht-Bsk1]AGN00610.1 Rieske (2Fe-2S) domain-containing protein [Salinarchaeum sp. Harcht-Bsk1]
MDDPYDKYPEDSDRRRFVKGVVGAGALTGVIGASASLVDISTAPPGAGGGPTDYMGIEKTGGPAPRGMPQIPLEYDSDGNLKGVWPEVEMQEIGGRPVPVAEMELGGRTYSTTWYQYCGSQNNPAIKPDADLDNTIRYTANPAYEWQSNAVSAGDPVRKEHFEDYADWGNNIGEGGVGKPAKVTWRSTELEPKNRIPVQLIRSPLIERKAENDDWLAASTVDGFMAVHNQCTHFCCVPGFKDPDQTDALAYNAGDKIYCQCHQSVYDPFAIIQQDMIALPRSE